MFFGQKVFCFFLNFIQKKKKKELIYLWPVLLTYAPSFTALMLHQLKRTIDQSWLVSFPLRQGRVPRFDSTRKSSFRLFRHLSCVRVEPIVWECLDMSSLTHTGDATAAHPPDSARLTKKKKNDATDVIERERKRTRPSVALNWETFSRLIMQLGNPDTSTRRGRRRCFVSCPFFFFSSFASEKKINYNSVWEKPARWRSIFAAVADAIH